DVVVQAGGGDVDAIGHERQRHRVVGQATSVREGRAWSTDQPNGGREQVDVVRADLHWSYRGHGVRGAWIDAVSRCWRGHLGIDLEHPHAAVEPRLAGVRALKESAAVNGPAIAGDVF